MEALVINENLKHIVKSMQEISGSLLSEKKVDMIIGFENGILPLSTKPVILTKPENVNKLVWNEYCDLNLVKLIPKTRDKIDKKIGVILDLKSIRSLVVLINEHQIDRDNITIIAMPSVGRLNRQKLLSDLKGREITDVKSSENELIVYAKDFEKTYSKSELIKYENIHEIKYPISDYIVKNDSLSNDKANLVEDEDLIEFEKKSPQERWEYFNEKLKNCERCYACRNACPLCYCQECFVDLNQPQWFGKTNEISENLIFHLIRAIHLTGRCVECGACTRACPMGIDLQLINKKIRQISIERFGFIPGLDVNAVCPTGKYKIDDSQEYIITEESEENN